jgi:hypothetical protein
MQELYLYILQLENDKILLHISSNNNLDNDYLFLQCQIIYEFAKENKPIKTMDIMKLSTLLEADYYVKRYMLHYGIENVRGGSYINKEIQPAVYKFLENELLLDSIELDEDSDIFSQIYYKYSQFNETQLQKEKDFLKTQLEYMKSKQIFYNSLCNSLKIHNLNSNFSIRQDIFTELDWMKNIIHSNSFEKLESSQIYRYRTISKIFEQIKQTFLKLNEKLPDFEPIIFLQNPSTIFDTFFYHRINIPEFADKQIENLTEVADSVLSKFEYMSYFIINRMDELEYDLKSNGANYVKLMNYSVEYIEQLLK